MFRKYRSLLVAVALVGGALVITLTISSVLDVVMQHKAPAVGETYTPPNNSPEFMPPVAAGPKSELRNRIAPPQTILMPGGPDAA
jgi:hypothetical protein